MEQLSMPRSLPFTHAAGQWWLNSVSLGRMKEFPVAR
jgi:hypothetical protein